MNVVRRECARVLLVGPGPCLILFRARALTGRVVWVPPGGEVENGESIADAARREVLEETGLNVDVGAVQRVVRERHSNGDVTYDCIEHVFVVHTSSPDIDTSGMEDDEVDRIDRFQWWPLRAIVNSDDHTFFPEALPELAATLLRQTEHSLPYDVRL